MLNVYIVSCRSGHMEHNVIFGYGNSSKKMLPTDSGPFVSNYSIRFVIISFEVKARCFVFLMTKHNHSSSACVPNMYARVR